MKNSGLALAMVLASSVYAGFYFDAGMGYGMGRATEKYQDRYDNYNEQRSGVGYDLGLKIGGGPSMVGYGLFFLCEVSWEISLYTPISYLLGPGIVFYPARNLQLGASFGLSPLIVGYEDYYEGYAYNFSIAYDFFNRNHGLLLGMKFYNTYGEATIISDDYGYYDNRGDKIKTSTISVFVKYAYRKKRPSIEDEERKQPVKMKQAIKQQSSFRTFAVKNFDKIVEDNQNGGGEHLNSLILLMESESIPKDEALILIKRAIRKSNGKAESFANELENSSAE
jgi:hypothetical protein